MVTMMQPWVSAQCALSVDATSLARSTECAPHQWVVPAR
jgi:hypothetical protein